MTGYIRYTLQLAPCRLFLKFVEFVKVVVNFDVKEDFHGITLDRYH